MMLLFAYHRKAVRHERPMGMNDRMIRLRFSEGIRIRDEAGELFNHLDLSLPPVL
jgi:hypothetical protein